jgi:hypothetical protein
VTPAERAAALEAMVAETRGGTPAGPPAAERRAPAVGPLVAGAIQTGRVPALAGRAAALLAGRAAAAPVPSSAWPLPAGQRGWVACHDGIGAGLR